MDVPVAVSGEAAGQGVLRLTVSGDLDMVTGKALATTMVRAVSGGGVTGLVVDLEHVTCVDACGVRALLVGHEVALRRGVAFQVINPPGRVRRILEITHLT
jgi:anti-anti-sigma factor